MFAVLAILVAAGWAKPDPFSTTITKELSTREEVVECYDRSESGLKKKKARVIVDVRVGEKKKPTLVTATSNPKSSLDKSLTECLEKALANFLYPVPRGKTEIRLDFRFPSK